MQGSQPDDPRVRFAAERTFLAWIRTGLAMTGFGFVVARFGMFLRELAAARGAEDPHSPRLSVWVGSALIVLGVAVTVVTATQHVRVLSRLRQGLPLEPDRWPLAVIVSFLLSVVGILMTVYLIRTAT
jgi:putative membrane protein